MRLHRNAKTCPNSRLLLCRRVLEQGWSLAAAAEAAGVSERTARKWLGRFCAQGEKGLLDRSSAPATVANRTDQARVGLIALLRSGPRMTAAEIAELLLMPVSTVSGILTQLGLGRLGRLEPPEPPNRYQRRHPGELVHIDVKKLGRIVAGGRHDRDDPRKPTLRRKGKRTSGWEFVHVCIDDTTRIAYVEVLDNEQATTAAGFLRRAVAFYASHGIIVERVMTDNGAAYSNERRQALTAWLDYYNRLRPHRSLDRQSPTERLHALRNNLLGSYT